MKKIILFITICLFTFGLAVASSQGIYENKKDNFLVITDIHLDVSSKHTMEIQPSARTSNNDLDLPTFQNLIAEVDKNIKNGVVATPKAIFLLGDLVGHIRSTSTSVLESESVVFNLLKKTFPTTPILYTFGNNDSFKSNYGSFSDQTLNERVNSPYEVATTQAGWLNGFLSTGVFCDKNIGTYPCMITEDKINGYYAAYVEPKLRYISINSVMFSPRHVGTNEQDAENQLKWLSAELADAKKNNDAVMIAMHVPPGYNIFDHSPFWENKDREAFLTIISEYQSIIIGMLAAHTHFEELKVITDQSKQPISGIYLTASLSTPHGNSPSVKTFYYGSDNGRWALTNYDAFGFTVQNNQLRFYKLYDYRQYYCDAKPTVLSQCLNRVTSEKIKKYFSVNNPHFAGVMESPDDIFLGIQNTGSPR